MKKKHLGTVVVDSGTLMIGDPAYLIENVFDQPIETDDVITQTEECYGAREMVRLACKDMIKEDLALDSVSAPFFGTGDPGLAVVFEGFGGDGTYQVYGICADEEQSDLITGVYIDLVVEKYPAPGTFGFARFALNDSEDIIGVTDVLR